MASSASASSTSSGKKKGSFLSRKWGGLSEEERKFVMNGTLLVGEALTLGGDGVLLSAMGA